MVGACILKQLGVPDAEALARVRNADSYPDTEAQRHLVHSFRPDPG
jgi:hypothetical protein